jgi:hypothetical protein
MVVSRSRHYLEYCIEPTYIVERIQACNISSRCNMLALREPSCPTLNVCPNSSLLTILQRRLSNAPSMTLIATTTTNRSPNKLYRFNSLGGTRLDFDIEGYCCTADLVTSTRSERSKVRESAVGVNRVRVNEKSGQQFGRFFGLLSVSLESVDEDWMPCVETNVDQLADSTSGCTSTFNRSSRICSWSLLPYSYSYCRTD